MRGDLNQNLSKCYVSVDPTRLKVIDPDEIKGVLVGVCCRDCGCYVFGETISCQSCTSSRLDPVELSSFGILYSFTVVWAPPPGWIGDIPYVLGQVELPEGPHILAEVVDCIREDLVVGQSVELEIQRIEREGSESGLIVYKWKPTRSAEVCE